MSQRAMSTAAMEEGRALENLDVRPTAIETVVPGYLYRFRKAGQFTDIRAL